VALLALGASSALAAPPTEFGVEGSDAGETLEPNGIAIDQQSGDVYVADTLNRRIDKFDEEGNFLLAFGWGVADGHSEELQTCTTKCFKGLRGSGAGQFEVAEGIAVDNDPSSASRGDVYVLDRGNARIQKLDPEGHFLLTFGGEVNADTSNLCTAAEAASCRAGVEGTGPGFFEPLASRSLAVGPDATVYVGDRNRVQKFSEGGALEGEIPLPGTGATINLAVDSAGNLYRVSGLLEGVHKYDPTGTELGSPRDEAGSEERLALTTGPAEELFLNDFRSPLNHLLSFDAAGAQLASFDRGEFTQNGERGIAYSEATEAIYLLNRSGASVRIVTPPPPGPLVFAESATEVGTTAATLNALANPEGPEATSCFFEYGTEAGVYPNQTTPTELLGGPFEDQPLSSPLATLQPRTTYHYRAFCENAAAESTAGPEQTFTTLPPVSIDATFATQVTATSATLGAELNPHGKATAYRFEYGTSAAYGTTVPIPDGSAGSGEGDVTRTAQIQGLEPLATYHYRVVAENELGVTEGPDQTFITQGAGSSLLPDARAWEMVTPPNKHGSPLEPLTEEGGLIQAPATCTPTDCAFASVALGPLSGESKGVRSPHDAQWLSRRGPGGWSTTDISTPHEEVSPIQVGQPSEYQFFAEDLDSSAVEPQGATPLSPQTTERTPYRREAHGTFVPLVTAANVPAGVKFGGALNSEGYSDGGVQFRTASPDLRHVVLASPQLFTEEFEPLFEANGNENLYELSAGKLTLASVLPSGEATSEAGLSVGIGLGELNMRGAISSDGSRVVFETNQGEHLYLRDNATQPQSAVSGATTDGSQCTEPAKACTIQLDELQPGAGGSNDHVVAAFQAASRDGSRVFFTDESRLTADSTARPNEPDLYMCEVEVHEGQLTCALSDLSVNHVDPSEAANVQGHRQEGRVSAIDPAGAHVYFAADGVLTDTPNARGELPVPGECQSAAGGPCNLYSYDTAAHQLSLVAVLSSNDAPDWRGQGVVDELGSLTARSSPNGRYFAFMSQRPLTGYDNRDAASGQRDEEVFLYDSQSGHLSCVSCNPTGARPAGVFDKRSFPGLLVDHPSTWGEHWLAASIPGWTLQRLAVAIYQSRYLNDQGRLFFNATDALVPQDTNKVNDVYEYEPLAVGGCTSASKTFSPTSGGCVSLISSGTSPEESAFLDATESGDDVFFLTASKLVPKDEDKALDVYDAAVGGGEPQIVKPVECAGDACQQPAVPPNDATPGSLTFNGPGNLLQCPKAKVRHSGKCVARKHHKAKHKKKGERAKRAASHNRGGQK
jgi:DNA-binding beta-propeller fold protein YncE